MWSGLFVGVLVTMSQAPAASPHENTPITVVLPGTTLTGTLIRLDAATVTFLGHEGRRTLSLDAVLRIEATRRDSPVDGAVVGGLIGLVFGVVANATYAAESQGRVIGPVTLLGAAMGGLYDATHESMVTLYERASAPARRTSLSFTIRF